MSQMSFSKKESIQQKQIIHQHQHQPKVIWSQHVQKYNHFFYGQQDFQKIDLEKSKNVSKLQDNQFIIIKEGDQKFNKNQFSVLQIKATNSPQIYQIYVNIGQFYSKLTLLIIPTYFQIKSEDIFDQGSNAIICVSYNPQKEGYFAIKSFKISLKNQFGDNLLFTIKQYMIALLMSELQIGPKLTKDFGFDIIVYLNYAQFTMQLCNQIRQEQIQSIQKTLKESLLKMHSLNIVHLDIKPQNILYSPTFNKYVFIDFGYTEMISENFGQKSFITGYIGTYYYSHQEMKECLNMPNYVDLYYNDVYCLTKSINTLQMKRNISEQLNFYEKQQRRRAWNNYFLLNKLKYYIYTQNKIKIYQKVRIILVQNDLLEVFRFLCNFIPSSFIQNLFSDQKFCNKFNKKNNQQFNQKLMKFVKFQFKNLDQESVSEKKEKKNNQIQINKAIQHIKILLFGMYSNIQLQKKNQFKISMNCNKLNAKKKFILDENIEIECQKSRQTYFELVFEYITFQQNYFKASFQEKNLILNKFIQNLKIDTNNYLNYSISKPILLKFVVVIKYLLVYCENSPYTQMKIRLFPKLCIQFTLVNPQIFTWRHTFNYFQGWYKTVYQQNKQFFLEMIAKLLKIRFASRLLQYRNDQIYFENRQYRQIYNTLKFLKDRKYLLKQLGNQKVVNQFLQIMRFVKGCQIQEQNFEFMELRMVITKNQKLCKQSKLLLLNQIRMNQILSFKGLNKQYNFNHFFAQNLYSRINTKELNYEIFLLCTYFQSRFQFFNCKTLVENIDQIIDCPQISLNFVGYVRAFIELYLGKQENAFKIYEQLTLKFKGNFTITTNYLTQLIRFQNSLRNQAQSQFSKDKITAKFLNNTISITQQFVPKIITYVKSLRQRIHYENTQLNYLMYVDLFFILRQCIRSLRMTFQNRKFFFDIFQQFYPQIHASFLQCNIKLIPILKQFKISQFCLRMINSQKWSQLDKILYENLKKINLESKQKIQQNFIEILYFVKAHFSAIEKEIFKCKKQKGEQQNFYERLLLKVYDYLIKKKDFILCLSYDSCSLQILIYFLEKGEYQNFLKYIEKITNFINQKPNSVYVSAFLKNIQQLQYLHLFEKAQIKNQILTQLFEFLQRKITNKDENLSIVQNSYFFMIANEFLSWSLRIKKFAFRTRMLKYIALSINSLIFKAKQQIYQKYYQNFIHAINCQQKNHHLKMRLDPNQQRLSQIRKKRYLWRKHFKVAKKRKINLKILYKLQIGQNYKQENKIQPYNQVLLRKFIKFHQNLNNCLN